MNRRLSSLFRNAILMIVVIGTLLYSWPSAAFAADESTDEDIYNYFVEGVQDGAIDECVTKSGAELIFDGKRSSGGSVYLSLPIISSEEFTVAIEVTGGSVKGSSGKAMSKIVQYPRLKIDGVLVSECTKISDEKWVYTVPAGTKTLKLWFYINSAYTFSSHTLSITVTDHDLIDGYYDAVMPERYNRFVSDVEDGELSECVQKDGYQIIFDGKASSSGAFYIPISTAGDETLTISVEVASGTARGSSSTYLTKIVEDPRLMIDGTVFKNWSKESDEKWVCTVPAGISSLKLGFYINQAYTFYAHTLSITITTSSELIEGYYGEYYPTTYNYFVSGVDDCQLTEYAEKSGYQIVFDGKASKGESLYLTLPVISDEEFTIALEAISGSVKGSSGKAMTKIVQYPRLMIDGVIVKDYEKVSDEKVIFTVPTGTTSLKLGFYINSAYTFSAQTLAVTETNLELQDGYYDEYLIESDDEEDASILAERELASENGRTVYFVSTSDGSDTYDGKTAAMPKFSLSQLSKKDDITILLKSGDIFYLDTAFIPGNNVRIASYGGEEKPILCGLQVTSESLAYDAATGFYSVSVSDENIGHIVIDGNTNWKRVLSEDDLTEEGEWFCAEGKLLLKSSEDLSGEVISYAKNIYALRITSSDVSIENIEISHFGCTAVNISTGTEQLVIKDCYVHHIGGAIGGEDHVRCGNGIQVWLSACNDISIMHNIVAYCFDAGITAQVTGTISRDESYNCENILFQQNSVSDCMYPIETFQSNTGGMHCEVEYSKNYLANCCDFVGSKYRKSTKYMAQICTWRILNADDVVIYRDNICIGSEQYAVSFTADQSLGTFVWEDNVFISNQETKFNVPEYYTGDDTFITVHSELTDEDQATIQQYAALAQDNLVS